VTNPSVLLLLPQVILSLNHCCTLWRLSYTCNSIFLNKRSTYSRSSKLETVTSRSIGISHRHASFTLFVATKKPSLLRIDRTTPFSMIHTQTTHTQAHAVLKMNYIEQDVFNLNRAYSKAGK